MGNERALSAEKQYDLEVSAATGKSNIIGKILKLRRQFIAETGQFPKFVYIPTEYASALKWECQQTLLRYEEKVKCAVITIAAMEVRLSFLDNLEVG